MVESEKRSLLGNGLLKHVLSTTNYRGNGFVTKHICSNNFLKRQNDSTETFAGGELYSTLSKLWKETWLRPNKWSHVEAGSNNSTVSLRVVGGYEKGSLESETVKYDRKSYGTWALEWLRWRGPVAIVNGRPVLSSERSPHINKPATVWQ
jgi:hypothetical protein